MITLSTMISVILVFLFTNFIVVGSFSYHNGMCRCVSTQDYDALKDDITILKTKLKELEKERKTRIVTVDQNQNNVVFTVKGNADSTNLGKNQPIIFPVVLENSGNAYDVRTGVFTAPVKGVYLFSVTLLNNPPNSRAVNAMLTKNGVSEVWLTCRDDTVYDSCSVTMAMSLENNDEVWVKHVSGGEIDNWCSFTGVLINQVF